MVVLLAAGLTTAEDADFQLWSGLFTRDIRSSSAFDLSYEYQVRLEDNASELKVHFFEINALYKAHPRLTVNSGDRVGLLKLLFDPHSLEILGVHVIGESAAELVHIGLAVMVAGGTLEALRDTVFNYPTMAEVCKVAAMDGLNRIRHTPRISKDEG